MLRLATLVFLLWLTLSTDGWAQPAISDRVALVIGVQNYTHIPALRNALNDAKDVSHALMTMGFSVVELYDPASKKEIQAAVRQYFTIISEKKQTAGLVYYSGHGVQVDGTNYLIPTEANPQIKADLEDQCVKLEFVMQALDQAGNPLNILILDACRNNPFRGFSRSTEKGLSVVEAPKGSYVVYATKPGSVASDGTGKNGLFTSKLLQYMQEPGLNIEQVFKKVARSVSDESGDAQRPWISSDYTGDFYFTEQGKVYQSRVTVPASEKVPTRSLSGPEALRKADSLSAAGSKKEAVAYYEQAAKTGIAPAQFAMGEILADDNSGMKNYARSFFWYKKAAAAGHKEAQYKVAWGYMEGEGVDRNFDSARFWYNRSAEQGNTLANHELGLLYLTGRGGVKNEALGVTLLERAANASHVPSQSALGNFYLFGGESIKSNRSKAINWLRMASRGGDKGAQETLDNLGVRN